MWELEDEQEDTGQGAQELLCCTALRTSHDCHQEEWRRQKLCHLGWGLQFPKCGFMTFLNTTSGPNPHLLQYPPGVPLSAIQQVGGS